MPDQESDRQLGEYEPGTACPGVARGVAPNVLLFVLDEVGYGSTETRTALQHLSALLN